VIPTLRENMRPLKAIALTSIRANVSINQLSSGSDRRTQCERDATSSVSFICIFCVPGQRTRKRPELFRNSANQAKKLPIVFKSHSVKWYRMTELCVTYFIKKGGLAIDAHVNLKILRFPLHCREV
jgi:hypothetical protein